MKIQINGEIGWEASAWSIRRDLEEAKGDITIEINSYGGDVFEGIEIYNAIKAYDKGTVTIEINSICASIASYISQAGDIIKAHDNSVFMIHNAWTFARGDHRALRKTADICESLSSIVAKSYLRSGKSLDEIHSLMDEDSYFYGDEMQENGFIDEIIKTEDEKNKDEAMALAMPKIKATLDKASEKYKTEDIMKFAAKLIPTKEVEKTEPEADTNVSKRNAILARLNLKQRSL